MAGRAQRDTSPANSYTTYIVIGQSVNIIPPAKRRGRWPVTGDRRPATGDRRPATGDRRPATGDRRPASFRWLFFSKKITNFSQCQWRCGRKQLFRLLRRRFSCDTVDSRSINFNTYKYNVFATRKKPRGRGQKHPRGKFAISQESDVRFRWNFHSV